MERISVVVCTKNSSENIVEVLRSVKINNPYEIILVDGRSSDNTVELAKPYCNIIEQDNGTGIAVARNIGINAANGDYVFFCGPDNVILPNSLETLRVYMERNNWVCVGMRTRLKNADSYLAKGMDLRWQLRIFEGERECVGSPNMFKSSILRKYAFSDALKFCDDTDLGFRLTFDGYKIGYSDIFCLEIGVDTEEKIKQRFYMYGDSDYQFYKTYESSWNEERKAQSRAHGFDCEYTDCMTLIQDEQLKTEYEPFFKQIANWRVEGWKLAEAKDKAKEKI